MIHRGDPLDELVRRSARVHDEDLTSLAHGSAAKALFDEVASMPHAGGDVPLHWERAIRRGAPGGTWARGPRRMGRRRGSQVAIAAVLAFAVVLSVPAFGVVRHIKSWLAGQKGPDAIVPTGADVVIASGLAGQAWKIIATPTDQGLCLFLVVEETGERAGLGGCGWGSDIRGYSPAASDLHWVEGGNGSGFMAALDRIFAYGVTAEGVARIQLELANGRTVRAHLVERPEGIDAPLNFFWAELGPREGADMSVDGAVLEPQWPLVHAIIARDSAGNVLEQRIVDQPKG